MIEQRKQVDVKVIHDSNANIHTLLVAVLLYSYQLWVSDQARSSVSPTELGTYDQPIRKHSSWHALACQLRLLEVFTCITLYGM